MTILFACSATFSSPSIIWEDIQITNNSIPIGVSLNSSSWSSQIYYTIQVPYPIPPSLTSGADWKNPQLGLQFRLSLVSGKREVFERSLQKRQSTVFLYTVSEILNFGVNCEVGSISPIVIFKLFKSFNFKFKIFNLGTSRFNWRK